MSFIVRFESGEEMVIPMTEGFNFGSLLRIVCERMDEDFNCERVLFYDRNYQRIDFGCDDYLVEENSFFNIIIVNNNLVSFAHRGPAEATSSWPWILNTELIQAWNEEEEDQIPIEMADEQPIAIEEDVREDEFLDAWHMELQEALDAIE